MNCLLLLQGDPPLIPEDGVMKVVYAVLYATQNTFIINTFFAWFFFLLLSICNEFYASATFSQEKGRKRDKMCINHYELTTKVFSF